MNGYLIPSWYKQEATPQSSLTLVTFLFGFSSACAVFTATTIVAQAYRILYRSKRLFTHPYVVMITAVWLSSVIYSLISYLFVQDKIPPSFWLFFAIREFIRHIKRYGTQCLMHIIINRIALIIYDGRRVVRLKWAVALILGLVNISVFIVWMPARLQISPAWIHFNEIWDRVEKGIFALIDLGLNLYFIYLVRSELVAHGLTKYTALYKFNLVMIVFSLSLDVILIGIMSLPDSFVIYSYIQFHPIIYTLKLAIEMNMAELIIKIVKSTSALHENHYAPSLSAPPRPTPESPSEVTAVANSSDQSADQSPISEPASGEIFRVRPMPSSFDAGDVVNQKASVAGGSVLGQLLEPSRGNRPRLMRNASEMTTLEMTVGYLNRASVISAEKSAC
ncbi:hypothetical protein KVR01_003508 [Diaporthe batatas]|uniref:uncharacterized protein n=1 Tax=Diaporthe batatas TaxID=748121 RepID=UPI001D03E417|nr:uncharacterized protein KVR01_003508 [Diaporthe batatas]KAG8167819.1 hypothetical protein KVR01_003508 [Diaporthe batatas]